MNMSESRRFRLTSPKAEDVEPSEFQSQAVVFSWAELAAKKHPELQWLFAVPNGGLRDKITAKKLKAAGVKAGVQDYFLPVPRRGYIGLAIEQKKKKRPLTDAQLAWKYGLEGLGWLTEVCYSASEAIELLQAYVAGPPTVIGPARMVRE